MQLKIGDLRRVADQTIKKEKKAIAIKEELYRAFGPKARVPGRLHDVAAVVNECLDSLVFKNESIPDVRISTLLEAANSESPQVRRLAARLLPIHFVESLCFDDNDEVRFSALLRLPLTEVRSLARRKNCLHDPLVREVIQSKTLSESKSTPPDKALSNAAKQRDPVEKLPDTWYERTAYKLCSDYGKNLERNWEENIVTNFCMGHFATSGKKIDRDKLLQAVYDCLDSGDKGVVKESYSLKDISARLLSEAEEEEAKEAEEDDAVDEILKCSDDPGKFMLKAESFFDIKHKTLPNSSVPIQIPAKGTITEGFSVKTERTLDRYVEAWNRRCVLQNIPCMLSWSPDADQPDSVNFHVVSK